MLEVKGKNGLAKIFTDIIDEQTIAQVIGILNSPITEGAQVRIMPDCHAGAGCVVGTTMTLTKKVCPNIVGVDIGCGMLVLKFGKIDIDLNAFDKACHMIASGFDVNDYSNDNVKLFNQNEKFLKQLKCYENLKDKVRLANSLGSLGGGNHFIELNKDEEDNIYLVIHTGSRNLGLQVAKYYQSVAEESLNSCRKEREELINSLKRQGREKEIQEALKNFSSSKPKISKDMAYLEDKDLEDYAFDMEITTKFASKNREQLAKNILQNYVELSCDKTLHKYINNLFQNEDCFETIHNYINFEDKIIRKGSISAHKGEKVIIPINMRDGSLIAIGKGNSDYNYSAPHGAGRIMSRSEARNLINLEEYKDSMKDIFSSTVNLSTIDEAPFAYKPIESILENIKDTVDVIKIIKPIYNFKASDIEE